MSLQVTEIIFINMKLKSRNEAYENYMFLFVKTSERLINRENIIYPLIIYSLVYTMNVCYGQDLAPPILGDMDSHWVTIVYQDPNDLIHYHALEVTVRCA